MEVEQPGVVRDDGGQLLQNPELIGRLADRAQTFHLFGQVSALLELALHLLGLRGQGRDLPVYLIEDDALMDRGAAGPDHAKTQKDQDEKFVERKPAKIAPSPFRHGQQVGLQGHFAQAPQGRAQSRQGPGEFGLRRQPLQGEQVGVDQVQPQAPAPGRSVELPPAVAVKAQRFGVVGPCGSQAVRLGLERLGKVFGREAAPGDEGLQGVALNLSQLEGAGFKM